MLAVLVIISLAVTWQQGLLQDGMGQVRRYRTTDTVVREEAAGTPADPGGPSDRVEVSMSAAPLLSDLVGDPDLAPYGSTDADLPLDGLEDARDRVLAETDNAVLRAGSTVGVEPSHIEMTPFELPEGSAGTVAVFGEGVSVTTEIESDGLYILTIDLPDEPSAEHIPGVWHLDDAGQGRLIPGIWDSEDNTITVYVDDFSGLLPAWLNPLDWLREAVDYVADYFTGRTDPPACADDAPDWISLTKYQLTSVHLCLQAGYDTDAQDRAQIKIKSNRSTLQIMGVPQRADDLWVQGQPSWARPLLADLATIVEVVFLGDSRPGDSAALLFGGYEMSYMMAQPRQDLVVSAHADLTIALVLANAVLSLLGGLDGGELLDTVLAAFNCAHIAIGALHTSTMSLSISNLKGYFEPLISCMLEWATSPDSATSTVRNSLSKAGFSEDFATNTSDRINRRLTGKKMKNVLGTLDRVSTVIGSLVNLWDTIVDPFAESRMTLHLTGDDSLADSRDTLVNRIDYDEVYESTGDLPVILIVDTSGSMGDTVDGQVKLEVAKESILEFLATVSPNRPVGLRTYPAGGGDCNSGVLRIPPSPWAFEMEDTVRGLRADGGTPTAEAIRAALDDIRLSGFKEAEIVLVSDGESTCDSPCDVASEMAAAGVEVIVRTAGFRLSAAGDAELQCIADATGGSHVEIDSGAELGEFYERNSKPNLEVVLSVPDSVLPSTDPADPPQEIEVVVRNDSNVSAKDVVVHVEIGEGPEPTRREVAIGNIAPGSESTAVWAVRPGFADVGRDLGLALSATAANTEEVVSVADAVAVEDPNIADDAGPILGAGRVVMMGDQLLSGVGSSHQGPDGGCRRSRAIGLLDVFGQSPERSVACANALIAHLAAPDEAKGVDSQINQLRELTRSPDAVNGAIVSVGATDFGLSELTRECVLSEVSCDTEVSGVDTGTWLGESVASDGPRRAAATTELVRALAAIDREMNAYRGSSRQAPILLLAQPRAFPFVSGACFERWHGDGTPLVTQPELNLYHHFVSAVNGTLEAAAQAARELGLPVFYVAATESAYLPDHTACSAEPYVQSLEPLLGVGPDAEPELDEPDIPALLGDDLGADAVAEFNEEFLAPNMHGEQALANAVLRWSRSEQALAAEATLDDRRVRRADGVAALAVGSPQGDDRPFGTGQAITVEPGRVWNTAAPGFLPGALVTAAVEPVGRVVASAVADETGTARLSVALPPETGSGPVTIVATGRGPSGEAVSVAQSVEVLPPLRPVHAVVLPVLAVLLLLGSLLLWRASRRRPTPSAPSSGRAER